MQGAPVPTTGEQARAAAQEFREMLRLLARRAGGDDQQAEAKVSDFNECILLAMASVRTTWPPYDDAADPGAAIVPPGLYRHYKGGLYSVLGVVSHHESRQPMALYVSHEHGSLNVRSLFSHYGDPDGFNDLVVVEPGGSGADSVRRRFEYVPRQP